MLFRSLDFAGIEIPEDMQGSSMKPLVLGKEINDWRKDVYYHYYEKAFGLTAHYGIRTDNYKLIHFYDPVDSWELYDLKNDVHEMHNLYNDPAFMEIKEDLHKRLIKIREEYGDTDPGN